MRTMSGSPCPHYDCPNKNSFGYCKTTACINPQYSTIGTVQYGQGVQKRIITNADRIRAMTDEELAKAFASACPEDMTENRCCQHFAKGSYGCYDCWLGWLKEEAERGE